MNRINNVRTQLTALLFVVGCSMASAHDFTVTHDGQKLYFNITDKKKQTVEVTYNGSIVEKKPCELQGKVEIPAQVKHGNQTYSVTAVGDKAFSGARKLQSVVLPTGIGSIGSFAFEACESLENIVFPAGKVVFGQGVFFKCAMLKQLTLGSDWTQIDLAMFQWSRQLRELYIPAKVQQLKNMKKLLYLEHIDVDANNGHFTAYKGVLYSKDGKKLYGCPRGYNRTLQVKSGTETITPGALIDCEKVVGIDLPKSLRKMSFRETSRMPLLEYINMRAGNPIVTAYNTEGKGVFIIQVAAKGVKLNVNKDAKKLYKSTMVTEGGDYAESRDAKATVYTVKNSQVLVSGSVNGVKNLGE